MTFVDANVLLRFLTKQPPEQAAQAREVLLQGQRGELELIVEPLTVAEVVYVLGGVYTYEVDRSREELLALLTTGAVAVEHEGAVLDALMRMSKRIDFPDAYLAARARTSGGQVATFDKGFRKLEVAQVDMETEGE